MGRTNSMATATRLFRYLPFLLALVVPAAIAQKPEPDGAISGVVIDGSSGAPLPEAVVFIAATPARPLGPQTRLLTDERGRFAFIKLPGDVTYSIAVSKLGYLDGGYGRDAAPSDPLRQIPLKTDEWIQNLKVTIWKPGGISGVVRDESGEPVVGVPVRALQRIRIQGRDDYMAGPATRTDDRGMYRIANLSPGRYLVQAPSVQAAVPTSAPLVDPNRPIRPFGAEVLDVMDVDDTQRLVVGRYAIPPPPRDGRHLAYPIAFHPSATAVAEATTIDLKFGDDRGRVDITLTPVSSVRVSGVVEGPPDALQTLTLRLLPAGLENLGFGAEVATALVASDGRFTFLNVPAGSYTIDAPVYVSELSSGPGQIGFQRVMPGPPTSPVAGAMGSKIDLFPAATLTRYNFRFSNFPYSGRAAVTVGDTDVTSVVVRMRMHATMTGRVVVESEPSRSDVVSPGRFSFQLDPAAGEIALTNGAGRSGRGGGAATDEFTVNGIIPGQYWLRVQGAPDWIVKTVTWSGRDYTNTPLDTSSVDAVAGVVVTVTNGAAEIAGTVRDSDDLKADATMVIVFPADPALWKNTGLWPGRMKTASVSSRNAFRLTGLPAGDYLVAAVSRSFSSTWREPEFLVQASRTASRVTLAWADKSTLEVKATVVK
jgi:Carboxypeptidase regulatory-like domain